MWKIPQYIVALMIIVLNVKSYKQRKMKKKRLFFRKRKGESKEPLTQRKDENRTSSWAFNVPTWKHTCLLFYPTKMGFVLRFFTFFGSISCLMISHVFWYKKNSLCIQSSGNIINQSIIECDNHVNLLCNFLQNRMICAPSITLYINTM